MRKVFLITGFNNWGKTTLISDLFGTKTFRKNIPQYYSNCPFVVMPQSNDDIGKKGYEKEFFDRLTEFEKVNGKAKYIASAFCPTKEPKNNSIEIIRKLFRNDQIEMLLLENKWCGHAKLMLPQIIQFYANEKNITVHKITSKSATGRLSQVQSVFSGNLP